MYNEFELMGMLTQAISLLTQSCDDRDNVSEAHRLTNEVAETLADIMLRLSPDHR